MKYSIDDQTFLLQYVGPHLEQFNQTKQNVWNCRCPICGDSKKNKTKRRGFFFFWKQDLRYKCYNCQFSAKLPFFLKKFNPSLYDAYQQTRYGNFGASPVVPIKEPIQPTVEIPKTFQKSFAYTITELQEAYPDHPAISYVLKRCIPDKFYSKLMYVSKFKEWTHTMDKSKFRHIKTDEPRLVIPFYSEHSTIFAYQGRSFDPHSTMKYITIRINTETPLVYGLERLNKTQSTYVLEGPIDSMFVHNAIAAAGSTSNAVLGMTDIDPIFVYDNDKRNPDIVSAIQRIIEAGKRVVIFPENIRQKDINQMVMAGYTTHEIMNLLEKHTYKGLSAMAAFSFWKKVDARRA